VPVYILMIGGLGIALGIALLGHRVIATIGERITELDNVRGFSVDFAVASTVLLSSHLGLPVSSTHVAVGSVTGAGLSQSRERVDFSMLGKIFVNWVLTLPIAGAVCAGVYALLSWMVG
jgi:PiT family inorganic phosphate transporter